MFNCINFVQLMFKNRIYVAIERGDRKSTFVWLNAKTNVSKVLNETLSDSLFD